MMFGVFRLLLLQAACLCLLALSLCAPAWAASNAIDREIERLMSLPPSQESTTVLGLQTLAAEAPPDAQARVLMNLGVLASDDADKAEAHRILAQLQRMEGREAKVAQALVRAALEPHAAVAKRLLQDAQRYLGPDVGDMLTFRLIYGLSGLLEETGQLDEAVRLRLQAIELADRMEAPRRSALARSALAWTYMTMQQLTEARELNGRALQLARSLNYPDLLAVILNTQAFIDAESGDSAAGLRAMNEALARVEESGDKPALALYLANAADFSLKSGDYHSTVRQSERALQMARELNDNAVVGVALFNRAMARIMLRQVEAGKADLQEALKIDESTGQLSMKAGRLNEAAGYLERTGDLSGALKLYLEYRPLADKLFREDHQQVILELQAGFERSERERELSLLQEEAALQAARLEGQRLEDRTWLAIVTAGLLTLLILAWLWRQTWQANVQLAQVNAQLLVQSERDPLTGLANRRRMAQVMAERHSDGRWQGCLMLIDLDHFKRINDQHGHAAGDTVLIEAAQRLASVVRAEDLVVRWGGEEFLIAAHAATSADAEQLAQRVLDGLCNAPAIHDQLSIPVTASIGYACFPMGPRLLTLPWERAVDLVDTALYLAKAHGRNRAYGVHTLQITREDDLLAVASSLEEAWRQGRVDLKLLQGCAASPSSTEGALA